MLHVTNGESVIRGFKDGAIPGAYLAWADPLHDGPVPETKTLEELSDIRARALSDFGWDSYSDIRQHFAERDRTLAGFRAHEETVLWFEHDLYDQLQLVQLLDWFSRQELSATRLSLIQTGEHPDTVRLKPDTTYVKGDDASQPFHGLGELAGEQLARLLTTRVPVSARHFEIGRETWKAFRAADPTSLAEVAHREDPAMPFLAVALQRLLEEYPWASNGLSRMEQQLLVSGGLGARSRQTYYLQSQEFEACPWGDASVYLRLEALASGPRPALDRVNDDEFAINDHGKRLLAGEDDWVRASGGIDRWIGGVHLQGADARWRWDGEHKRLGHRA